VDCLTNTSALDALRAAAVDSSSVYHFDVPYVNRAVGVEMLVVLSGFLITWLIRSSTSGDAFHSCAVKFAPAFARTGASTCVSFVCVETVHAF